MKRRHKKYRSCAGVDPGELAKALLRPKPKEAEPEEPQIYLRKRRSPLEKGQ